MAFQSPLDMDQSGTKPRVSPVRPAGAPGTLQRPPPTGGAIPPRTPVSSAPPVAVARPAPSPLAPAQKPAPEPEAEAAPAKASPRAGKLATTGIAGLDAQLGGGIPRGTT